MSRPTPVPVPDRKPPRTSLLCTLALLTAIVPAACRPAPPPPSAPSPLHTKAAPDFERRTLAGASVDTASLRGKVVVVKFFAKYCEPCTRTLPAAESLSRKHAQVVFLGVSEDEYERDARELVQAYGLTFPVIMDRGGVLAGRYRVTEIPATFVIDPQGVVQWIGGPNQTEHDLEAAIRAFGG